MDQATVEAHFESDMERVPQMTGPSGLFLEAARVIGHGIGLALIRSIYGAVGSTSTEMDVTVNANNVTFAQLQDTIADAIRTGMK